MGDYVRKPEPGRHISKTTIIEKIVEKQADPQTPMDINALAQAVAKAINVSFGSNSIIQGVKVEDTFDTSKTLDKLADTMTVETGTSQSNFNDLGNVHQTKKTKKDKSNVAKTIDILSNLDD